MDSQETTIAYAWQPVRMVPPELREECRSLYNHHYGLWGAEGPRPGRRISLSKGRLGEWFESEDGKLAYARCKDTGELIGYAIIIQTSVKNYGVVSWVTQLVIHGAYRNRGVGKTLLYRLWGQSDHFAWGLATANPFAVRALEKATRRRCDPARIVRNYRKLMHLATEHVPYVGEAVADVTRTKARVDTNFHVDHSTLRDKLNAVVTAEKPWLLGELGEGMEWLAFTFQDQPPFELTPRELEILLDRSDAVVRDAYSRMRPQQGWARGHRREVSEIARWVGLQSGAKVVDFGCGRGRHSLEFARAGCVVHGVDYVEGFILEARKSAKKQELSAQFTWGDCRTIELGDQFDLGLCLYDVVGSYADDGSNRAILANLVEHVRPGGHVILSVMNRSYTDAIATQKFDLNRDFARLTSLKASRTMETSGDIFNPDFFLLDTGTGVVYRKEQFTEGRRLPAEFFVRDRRFYVEEISEMCVKVGLEVIWTRHVSARSWEDQGREAAKEILLFCRRA